MTSMIIDKRYHNDRRLPAEWEYDSAILLAWPHSGTDWLPILEEAQRCYADLIRAITMERPVILVGPEDELPHDLLRALPPERIRTFACPTNDTWFRDMGPITVEVLQGGYVMMDFCFNGWGMKFAADKDNLVTSRMVEGGMLHAPCINKRGFVLEGGSIESDGRGTLLTTSECLLSPNRNAQMSRNGIEEYLADTLGFTHQLWLDHGALAGDDTDSHIDTLARLAPDDTIVYVACDDPSDEHYESLQAMKRQLQSFRTPDGKPYRLMALPMADAVITDDGERLPATYANFLVTPTSVFMPGYRQPDKDRQAAAILAEAYSRPVHIIDCTPLIIQHGSLHCITMQVPASII